MPRFSGAQYRALRNGRCFTLHDTASRVTALLPESPVTGDNIRRLEGGAVPRPQLLRSRLDAVYGAGGFTCNERVEVGGVRPRFVARFPEHWVGPVWFEFDADRAGSADVLLRQGSKSQELRVVPGASVADERVRSNAEPYVVQCPAGWSLRAGVGACPGAETLDLDRYWLAPASPGPSHDVHDLLLRLFGRTRDDLARLVRGPRGHAPAGLMAGDAPMDRQGVGGGGRFGHFPTDQAALKCLYLVIHSLDPTGAWRRRWTNRWKKALNAFDITFNGRLGVPGGGVVVARRPRQPRRRRSRCARCRRRWFPNSVPR